MKNRRTLVAVNFKEWIARREYAAGDSKALGELWKLHIHWLRPLALKYARGNRDMADEGVGELGMKLSRPEIMRMYRPEESWRQWARCILHNLIRDSQRRKFRARFQLTKTKWKQLKHDGVSETVMAKLQPLWGRSFWDELAFQTAVAELLSRSEFREVWATVRERAQSGQSHQQPLHENHESLHGKPAVTDEQALWNEFLASFQWVLRDLPEDWRAIFLMHASLGWSFIRIAEILHGKCDANLVSRPYYKAREFLETKLTALGHGNLRAVCTKRQTIA